MEIDFSKEDCAQLVINRLQFTYYANSKAHFSQQNQSNTSLSKWCPNKAKKLRFEAIFAM